jgi:hypothetical protein
MVNQNQAGAPDRPSPESLHGVGAAVRRAKQELLFFASVGDLMRCKILVKTADELYKAEVRGPFVTVCFGLGQRLTAGHPALSAACSILATKAAMGTFLDRLRSAKTMTNGRRCTWQPRGAVMQWPSGLWRTCRSTSTWSTVLGGRRCRCGHPPLLAAAYRGCLSMFLLHCLLHAICLGARPSVCAFNAAASREQTARPILVLPLANSLVCLSVCLAS